MNMWRKILLAVSLSLNIVLFYSLIWGENGIYTYREMKGQAADMARRIEDLEQQNKNISREVKLLKTDTKYQESMIRSRLNFVRDNEILYIFPPTSELDGASNDDAKN